MISIKINDTDLENIKKLDDALDGTMVITLEKGNYTFDKLAELFVDGAKIETSVGDSTAIYYNKSFEELRYSNDIYEIHLSTTELQESAEDELTDRADTSDDAITELAEMMAALEERVTALEGNGTESKVEEVSND